MPQVVLAVCAVFVFSLFAINQHRGNQQIEQAAQVAEIELAATDVARDQLNRVLTFAFDEADIGSSGLRSDPTGLSAIGLDADEISQNDYDDIDDFHNYIDTLSVDWHDQIIDFVATAEIRYVDPNDPDQVSAIPTLAKELAIIVAPADSSFESGANVIVRLLQVVTPAWKTIHG